jgi:DNA-binding Lrp family transcriptional regulator/uncharacterized ParB-like nuclease family protein
MSNKYLDILRKAFRLHHGRDEVKSFNADQEEEAAFDTLDHGTRQVPLERIVGSVGRYHDFDKRFRPKAHVKSQRYEAVKDMLRQGRQLPPVCLYQIKDEYYVLDGNHRVAAAKELGRTDIRATILEFIPSKNTVENLIYQQRAEFINNTGLPYLITVTEVGQYAYLLDQIYDHQQYLGRMRKTNVEFEEAARDWYQSIYRPLTAIIRSGNLRQYFPQRTLDDLYVYISSNLWQQDKKRKYGMGIDRLIPNDMEAFRSKMKKQKDKEYPDILQEISAFVLVNVKEGKKEHGIWRKLADLDEVQEIHAIHGNVDLLVKVKLQRDLLTSDSQNIYDFINTQVCQLEGVTNTQTLIPGKSLVK